MAEDPRITAALSAACVYVTTETPDSTTHMALYTLFHSLVTEMHSADKKWARMSAMLDQIDAAVAGLETEQHRKTFARIVAYPLRMRAAVREQRLEQSKLDDESHFDYKPSIDFISSSHISSSQRACGRSTTHTTSCKHGQHHVHRSHK